MTFKVIVVHSKWGSKIMKILLTGTTGYIACSLERYLSSVQESYELHKQSVRNFPNDFQIPNGTEVLIHSAALVHKKESNYTEQDYFKVNCELTTALATKAKAEGVKHFIFLSTMAVYGTNGDITEIDEHTPLLPTSMYGKTKLEAEKRLLEMEDDNFIISIIRPPMVYGLDCPGNYSLLSKLARKTLMFPYVQNARSMIFIDNLTEFIRLLIVNRDAGIFHPQDRDFIQTSDMVKEIASVHGRKIVLSRVSGIVLNKVFRQHQLVLKVFGDLTYSKTLSNYSDNSYQKVNFKEAVRKSELKM
ncbi:NAD-dependent epimerase/dehydratase family protein [Psychrobacillus vulpis]|uniref:NAD-dependent epimerase/dehydratase family protein n=1 Tax=Psychrobacillus vulpis TaxID=2325572 RepID=A0A544TUW0_9BACI|nr:NAD-dependent epimerase/dehydratase family protein [Psychrobacillus vulpis]TQR21232.1 NAD-dependent epimerase/dehydratase family protein [Psychrobacillus vulpis]